MLDLDKIQHTIKIYKTRKIIKLFDNYNQIFVSVVIPLNMINIELKSILTTFLNITLFDLHTR